MKYEDYLENRKTYTKMAQKRAIDTPNQTLSKYCKNIDYKRATSYNKFSNITPYSNSTELNSNPYLP